MTTKGITIKARITITLVLLPLLSLLVVGSIALIQNRDSLAQQAEANLERLVVEKTAGYDLIFQRIQQEAEAAAGYARLIYDREGPRIDLERRMLEPWTGSGYGNDALRASLGEEILRLQRAGQTLEVIVSNNAYLTLGYLGTETELTVFDNQEVVDIIEKLEAFRVTERPWYIKAREEGKTVWTNLYVDANTKKLTVTCAAPVYTGAGEFKGVVGFDVLLETIQNDILAMDIGYKNYAFMTDAEGNALVQPGGEQTDTQWHESYAADNLLRTGDEGFNRGVEVMIKGRKGIELFRSAANKQNYLAYAAIDSIDARVGIVVPQEEIVRPVEESGKLLIIALAVIMIVAMALGLILSNQVTRPIEELTVVVDKASRGLVKVEEIPIKKKDEVGVLANAFNRMIRNLAIAVEELEKRKE
jgi:two-component system sensor histidine kinase/response regulator